MGSDIRQKSGVLGLVLTVHYTFDSSIRQSSIRVAGWTKIPKLGPIIKSEELFDIVRMILPDLGRFRGSEDPKYR
jgi:hypothetical protein